LCLILISSLVLSFYSYFFTIVLALQAAFYAMVLIAWFLEKSGIRLGIPAMPLYFFLANLASIIAFYKFLRGERYARWEPIRESGQNVQAT
jgi:hypothetical protein